MTRRGLSLRSLVTGSSVSEPSSLSDGAGDRSGTSSVSSEPATGGMGLSSSSSSDSGMVRRGLSLRSRAGSPASVPSSLSDGAGDAARERLASVPSERASRLARGAVSRSSTACSCSRICSSSSASSVCPICLVLIVSATPQKPRQSALSRAGAQALGSKTGMAETGS